MSHNRPPLAAINEMPLSLAAPDEYSGYRVVSSRGRNLCMLYDWNEAGGVQRTIPDAEVRALGEWIVTTLNAALESIERSGGGAAEPPDSEGNDGDDEG